MLADEFRAVARSTGHELAVRSNGAGGRRSATRSGRSRSGGSSSKTRSSTRRRARAVRIRTARRNGSVLLTVEDEGPGIPAEHAAQIFERFYRVEGSMASGSGLGLAIARELAELMGGSVELDVSPGRTDLRPRPARTSPGAAPFSRENGRLARTVATVSPMRLPVLAAVDRCRRRSRRRRCVGASARAPAGSTGHEDRRRATPRQLAACGAARRGHVEGVAALPARASIRERIFAKRSPGVVTIFAYFGDPGSRATTVAQGSGFVISPRATSSRTRT